MANINLETLSQKHKKKKDALIIWGLLIMAAIVFTSVISYFIDDSNVKTFKEKQDVSKDKDFKISPQQDIKESWAMSVDTRLEEQKKEFTNLRDDVKAENEKTKNEIKDIILESVATQSQKMEDFTLSMDAKINELANSVDTKVMEQQNQIEDLYLRNSMNNGTPQGNIPVVNGEIILGDDLLPKMPEQQPLTENVLPDTPGAEQKTGSAKVVEEKVEEKPYIPVPTKSIVKMQQIDTSKNQAKVAEDKVKLEKVEKAKLMKMSGFHLMTGLTQAYMITGAYAPAFDSGEEEPLPVLLQAEGDILIANDDSQTVDKCFFIGTAKGNMNSQTADIRLVKLSCSVADGSKKIEGNISGWVIGENGIPGVQGELLHKNGAWLSKTFVAGFLQTFASAFGNTDTTDIYIGDSGNNNNNNKNAKLGTSVSNNAQSAAAGGLSTVFGKLGDYYIKMAEQIFPVIEVKGGRTVNILLKGGESFTVTDFNKLDLSEINDKIDDENLLRSQLGETEYDKLRKEQTAEDASKEESMFKSIENTNSNNSFGGGNQNNAGSNNFFNQFTGGQQNSNNKGGF